MESASKSGAFGSLVASVDAVVESDVVSGVSLPQAAKSGQSIAQASRRAMVLFISQTPFTKSDERATFTYLFYTAGHTNGNIKFAREFFADLYFDVFFVQNTHPVLCRLLNKFLFFGNLNRHFQWMGVYDRMKL